MSEVRKFSYNGDHKSLNMYGIDCPKGTPVDVDCSIKLPHGGLVVDKFAGNSHFDEVGEPKTTGSDKDKPLLALDADGLLDGKALEDVHHSTLKKFVAQLEGEYTDKEQAISLIREKANGNAS